MRYSCVGLLIVFVFVACGDDSPPPDRVCAPGTTNACLCPGNRVSSQTCLPDGTAWGACVCSPLVDAGGGCGDGYCQAGESCGSCSIDCGSCTGSYCGDGSCDVGEDCASCPSDCGPCPGPYCGDGSCDVDESCASCSSDCGACTTGCSVLDAGSVFADDCGGNQICICPGSATCTSGGTCQAAFGRRYLIGVVGVSLPEFAPDGDYWDLGGNPPDPFVQVTVDGTVLGASPAGRDLYNVAWEPPFAVEATIVSGSSVQLDVYDQDVSVHDGAFVCRFAPITAATLRSRSVSCSGALGRLVAVIVPPL